MNSVYICKGGDRQTGQGIVRGCEGGEKKRESREVGKDNVIQFFFFIFILFIPAKIPRPYFFNHTPKDRKALFRQLIEKPV